MKIIKSEESHTIQNSANCTATIYDFGEKNLDISTAVISGRYPSKGFLVNTKVKDIVFCIEGSGTLFTEKETIPFKAGDAILIDKNEKYFFDAHCKISENCYPAWYPEQNKQVD